MVPPDTPQQSPNSGDFLAQLSTYGWVCLDNFLSVELTLSLRNEAMQSDQWSQAGVGLEGQTNKQIRRDKTFWLTGESAFQAEYLAKMEAIRLEVNRYFFAGLFEYEAHFAHYPKGAFYRKHRDALRGSNARVLTSVCYLNPQWQPEDGGELIIYNDSDTKTEAKIAPTAGSLVLFWSEDFPHEVLPASNDRYSIAGWFRRNVDGTNPL